MDYQRLIEEIKARIDIVDLISGYVDLKKAGTNYRSLCPFHSEKTPSFMVSPEKQIFHCFGCNAGGDIIGFMMKQEGIPFVESVRMLAEKAGIKIEHSKGDGKDLQKKRDAYFQIHKAATSFFIKEMEKSKIASEYFVDRSMNKETIKIFSIGFAPNRRDDLYRYLKKEGFSDKDILETALIKSREGRYFDAFRGRIIFPIFNLQDKPIAFGGRVIDDDMPKYLNSAETVFFKKGETLFGLNLVKNRIKQKGYVIIVEGYFDVMTCYQNGFDNVVAPLGTALTEGHIRLIKRFTNNILLVFDGDTAGISAAKRSLDLLLRYGLNPKVLLLPENSDPDSYIRDHGRDKFRKILSNAQGYISFMLSTGSTDIDNLREIFNTLSNVTDGIMRSRLISELSDKASVSEVILREEVSKRRQNKKKPPLQQQRLKIKSAEDILLGICLSFPEALTKISQSLDPEEVYDPLIRKALHALYKNEGNASINSLYPVCSQEEIAYISGLMVDPMIDEIDVDTNIKDCIKKIKRRSIKESINNLEQKIKLAESKKNMEELRTLLIEKQKIVREQSKAGLL